MCVIPCYKSARAENDSRFVSLPLRAQKGLHLCCQERKKERKREKRKEKEKEKRVVPARGRRSQEYV